MEVALLLKCNIVGEFHITRKQYLDGSIPTGFQRTGILGIEGEIPLSRKKVQDHPAEHRGGLLPRGLRRRPHAASIPPTAWACR